MRMNGPGANFLIFGAGAVGRGFIPYALRGQPGARFSFVDRNPAIVEAMLDQGSYKIAVAGGSSYEFHDVQIQEAMLPDSSLDMDRYDLVFSAVGVNEYPDLKDSLASARAVISCENDFESALKLRRMTGNPRIYFGIPDVITSNTAPASLLADDPLTVVTERGTLVVERGEYGLTDRVRQVDYDELAKYWNCKMFIHNAPHAMIAYLGWRRGYEYIHEAIGDPLIEGVVVEGMWGLASALVCAGLVDDRFAEFYTNRELARFKNRLLYDPIERVARDPIRKLRPTDRLVLGCRLCLSSGIRPGGLAKVIRSAIEYDNPNDPESVKLQSLRGSEGDEWVLESYSGINRHDPLGAYILSQDLAGF